MSDTVSLKAYVAHVESLLNGNAVDEAIHHCRRILQSYPKHIETYRLLGRALLLASRWDEAGAALRRVLSVIPDDFVAHYGLSEAYLEQNRTTDAIWHLERAYEHDPNNTQIIDTLRDLYKRYRNTDQPRIQLTAAAVARQYAQNGLYEQAANTLRSTITRIPDRIDLRALLAETLWGAELRIEAAETALDVLAQLPDCLSANMILAELWLREDRPSDARRYVNRIEAVDPYLALEVATGQTAPEDAYQLEELDYRQMAQSEMTNEQPDWLSELGGLGGAETGTSSASHAESERSALLKKTRSEPTAPKAAFQAEEPKVTPKAVEPSEELPDASDLIDDGIPDWLTDINVAQQAAQKQTGSLHQEFEAIDWTFVPSDEDEAPEATTDAAARDLRRETATHASIMKKKPFEEEKEELPDWLTRDGEEAEAAGEGDAEAEDPLAWLNQPPDDSAAEPEAPKEGTNPLAWLEEAGIEVDENAQRQRFVFDTDDEDVKMGPEKVDPLAWMQNSGIEFEEDELPDEFQFDAAGDSDDDDDPLAWMRASGIEMADDEAEAPSLADVVDTPEADDEDALAWLQEFEKPAGAGDEDAGLFEQTSDDAIADSFAQLEMAEDDLSAADEDDGFEWLQDETLAQNLPATRGALETTEAELTDEAESGWMMNDEDMSPGKQFDPSPDKATQLLSDDALEPTGATFEEADILDEGLFADADSEAAAQQASTSQRDIATASDLADRQEDMSDKDDKTPDWSDSGQAGKPDDANNWLDSFSFDEDEGGEPAAESDVPEWLAELGPEYVHPESLPASAADKNAFEWMGDELQMESVEPADVPDWLTEAQPTAAAPQAEPEAAGDFEWMSDLSDEDEEADIQPADVPDWLTEAQPAAPAPQAEPEAAGDFEWMSDELQMESVEPAEMPDWLTEAQPAASAPQAEPEAAGEFEWMSDLSSDEEEAEIEPADVPDWLTEAQPAASAPQAEPEAAGDFEWMSDLSSDEEEAADAPDWLTEAQPAASALQAEPEAAGEFEWMSDLSSDEEEAIEAADAPDWLTEAQPAASAPQAEPQAASEFEWMSDLSSDEEEAESAAPETPMTPAMEAAEQDWTAQFEEADASDVPAWLNELEAEAPTPAAAEAATEWEAETEFEEAAVSEDTPDWLRAIGEESETEPEAEAPGEIEAEFEWQTEIEDAAHVETVQPGEQPEWLSELSTEAPTTKPATEAEFGWLIDDEEETAAEVEAEAEMAHPPATNAPDWLNAMVPGVDLDYAPAEDEPVETEFAEDGTHRERSAAIQAETPARDFQWVADIVEEETAQIAPAAAVIPPPAPPEALPETPVEAPEPKRARFQFSKPPAWKRGKQSEASSMADWPSDPNDDNGELDLPDWLK